MSGLKRGSRVGAAGDRRPFAPKIFLSIGLTAIVMSPRLRTVTLHCAKHWHLMVAAKPQATGTLCFGIRYGVPDS